MNLLNKYRTQAIAFGVIVLVIMVGLITPSFAISIPVSSITITSQNTSYENKEPGSWQVEKSGKWIEKGIAEVKFDVSSVLMSEDPDIDIIFVLDISGSMKGEKLERVKQDTTELLESLLSNGENRAALITFGTESRIVSGLTNDKDLLIQEVNNLTDTGTTNYYQALVNVDTILKDYQQEDNREMIVLFLTDGYPNKDTPNQIAQYRYLKSEYSYITINGIQYEMGNSILDPIKEISDNQFIADMETLNNVLFNASVVPILYNNFQIVDYIENDYFTLESEDDITVSVGEVKLEEENGLQKITWTISNFRSGSSANLTMDLKLKEELIGQGGVYPTNRSEQVISQIKNKNENINSTLTPALQESYQVIYDGNTPEGCSVENLPENESHSVFDVVSISEEEASCSGYEFKGWEIISDGVTRINDDYFIMPESDVILRAKWGKVSISKSMDGTVNEQGDPIMKYYNQYTSTDYHSSTYKSKVTSIVTKDNTEIPATAIESWDVSVVGDGSVIAYIEDDGRGTGTYKVTIGGQGGIIANSNSSYLFYNFSSLESIDLTYLDTSQVTNMSNMFYLCSNLTSLNLSSFNTSNVINMSRMFNNCSSLTSLNLSNFDTSNVVDMSSMFSGCRSLNSLDVSSFNTSNVTNMSYMFNGCRSLNSLDVSRFKTSNVINISGMFYNCNSLISLNVNNFDTSKVTNMYGMFSYCSSLSSLNLSNFDTSNVTDMSEMFYDCDSLTDLDLSMFDTSKVTNMSSMFSYCSSLSSLNLSNFDTSNVVDMSSMFSGCRSLRTLNMQNAVFNATNYSYMFNGSSGLTITVKDEVARSWIQDKLGSNGTAVIA